jgi:DNA sulfur modification protein DndE
MTVIENIRISEKGKQGLIRLKRKTGIENWNTLCRWALCRSLAEESTPPHEDHDSMSNVEMTWKTFGGEYADIYEAIVSERLHNDGIKESELTKWFHIHLHRGISYLSRSTNSLEELISSVT